MSIINASTLLGAGADGYQIERSLRFDGSANLNRSISPGTNAKIGTFSFWCKRSKLGSGSQTILQQDANTIYLGFDNNGSGADTFGVFLGGNSPAQARVTTQVFRDPSSWYHFIVAVDTTHSTASERLKVYVNGTQITAFSTSNTVSQNVDVFASGSYRIGSYAGSIEFFSGYLTEINFIDGQALTPSSFGETDTITGVWKPKRYSGTYGTNGFYLKFADNSGTTSTTLGKDSSPNGNNFTPNNFSVTAGAGNDSLIDTPTPYADGGNGRGNYCTANPINSNASTLRNGNLEFIGDTGAALAKGILGTIGVSTGKWYFEVTPDSGGTFFIGVAPANGVGVGSVDLEYINGAYSYRGNGDKCQGTGGSGTFTAYGSSYASPDVIGVALDLDNGAIYFAKNNTWQNSGVPTSGSSKTGAAFTSFSGSYTPMACGFNGATATLNFGQRSFSYTPPAGFLALNTQNLPEPSIKKPSSYMDVKLYTGTSASQTISGLGFSPDLVWVKRRSNSANSHALFDAVRGAGYRLSSNETTAEVNNTANFTAFTSDGFSVASNGGETNLSPETYVAWCWDESATPGFDIVTYTGNGTNRTIAHSLGVAPKLGFIKRRDSTSDWSVYYNIDGLGAGVRYLTLNSTAAGVFDTTYWNSSVWTSTLMQLGTNGAVNTNTATYVAYLWSEVAGFSKFGSYTGNGSSDGPFVACNFRPRWVMTKRTDTTSNWMIMDAGRNPSNVADNQLYPNLSFAEAGASSSMDLTSNGFKLRNTGSDFNAATATYIFAAFAESPQKYSLAR